MSFTSISRACTPFTRYSESPVRKSRRPTVISPKPWYASGSSLGRSFTKVSITSAIESGGFDSDPLKITSSIERPRSWRADCSPRTQRIASATLDLPQPFGPTTPVTPSSKATTVLSMNDLNPTMSRRRMRMPTRYHDPMGEFKAKPLINGPFSAFRTRHVGPRPGFPMGIRDIA